MMLNESAVIAPGNSIGTLIVNGGLTLGNSEIYQYELDRTLVHHN
jgi:hypothetical protein